MGEYMRKFTYFEAYLDDFNVVNIYMSLENYGGVSHTFYLEDEEHQQIPLVINDDIIVETHHQYECVPTKEVVFGKRYYVYHEYGRYCDLVFSQIVKTKAFDRLFYYTNNDLGSTYQKEKTTFKLWAPTAYDVWVEISLLQGKRRLQMQRGHNGIYEIDVHEDLENIPYVYQVSVNGCIHEVIDPYAKASTPNAKQSVVVDLGKIRMKEYPLDEMQSPCDAIIYEVCVRDFSEAGTIQAFLKDELFTHIKQLGVTHIQCLPLLDFQSMDDLHPNKYYNWGYDAHQWMAFENSYASNPSDPISIIRDVVKLIDTCHANQIRVNLDVVFNHVYDVRQHALEKCVPHYYFQNNVQGEYSNATMCGNDIDSKMRMCRKLIVDSCAYLVKTFHIDGLRFDLMGILDVDTMNEVVSVCKKYNKEFMVYGEGWNMPSFLNDSERAAIPNQEKMPLVGHFSDRFRDTLKGSTQSDQVHDLGYLLGNTSKIYEAMNVMGASTQEIGNSKLFSSPIQVVNYVECHDNMTSWDKINGALPFDQNTKKEYHKLLIAAILLAQGIPFLHGGQEFARSKNGLPNTYNNNSGVNKINRSLLMGNQDMIAYTKTLVGMRKQYSCLRQSDANAIYKSVYYGSVQDAILEYRVHDENEALIILFNPTQQSYSYTVPSGYEMIFYKIKLSEPEQVTHVEIHGITLVILKK